MAEQFNIICANIIRRDSDVLLVQEKQNGAEQWRLPSGLMERGESSRNCVVRTTEDETGLNVMANGLVGVYTGHSTRGAATAFVFHSNMIGGDPAVPDDSTLVDVAFHAPDRVSSLDLQSDYIVQAVNDFMDGSEYPLSILK